MADPATEGAASPGENSTARVPTRLRDLRRGSLWPALRRTVWEFRDDDLADLAAALTYYGVLALFPALIVLVALLGLFGDPKETTATVTEIAGRLGPASAADAISEPVRGITENRGAAGVLFAAGLAAALFSASGYVGAFTRASNRIYETREGRPFWKLRPLQMGVTLLMVLMLALVLLALVMTGPLVDAVAAPLGIGDTAVTAWKIAKWPVLVAVVMTMVSMLYYAAPNVRHPGFRWVTPGSVVALLLWLLASVGFAFYVANFGSYNETYGTLGGVITFLVWLWISNIAVLLGAELNAELERGREVQAGVPGARREIQLAPREEPDGPDNE